MVKKNERIGLRAYARLRGCSPSAVSRAIKEGRITKAVRRDKNGNPKIDPVIADKEWAANTDPARGFVTTSARTKTDLVSTKGAEESKTESEVPLFEDSRAKREAFSANLMELQYQKESGLLVEVAGVERELFKMSRMVRDAMLNIPNRISAELAAMDGTFEVRERLLHEITEALWGLSKRIKLGPNVEIGEEVD